MPKKPVKNEKQEKIDSLIDETNDRLNILEQQMIQVSNLSILLEQFSVLLQDHSSRLNNIEQVLEEQLEIDFTEYGMIEPQKKREDQKKDNTFFQ